MNRIPQPGASTPIGLKGGGDLVGEHSCSFNSIITNARTRIMSPIEFPSEGALLFLCSQHDAIDGKVAATK